MLETLMPKVLQSTCRKLWCLCMQKINFISNFLFWDIVKILQTYFWYFRHTWLRTPKMILSTSSDSISFFSWRYCTDMQTSYFGYSGHAWLRTSKMIASTCRLSTSMVIWMPKVNFIIHFFLEILHCKESYNFIGQQHFGPYLRTRILIRDCWWNINKNISFHFRLFPRNVNGELFLKIWKNLLWGHFGSFLPKSGQK